MQARDNITEDIKEAARRSEAKPFAAMDSVWDRIEERLDEDERKNRKVIPFRTISIAAAVLLLLSLGAVYVTQKETVKKQDDQAYVQQKKELNTPPADGMLAPSVNTINTAAQPEVQRPQSIAVTSIAKGPVAKHKTPDRNQVTPQSVQLPRQPVENHDVFVTEKIIKGNVKDETGEPMPGVMVYVKGSREGAITDIEGNYEIKVGSDRKELEIRGIGMLPATVAIEAGQLLATTLKADQQVDLVEIRSCVPPKKGYVSSITTAQNQNIARRPVTDIARALEGDLPGVKIRQMSGQSGATTDFQIAGLNSQTASGPLVVIDGMFYNGSSVSLKPSELESLTVLKDETATATYGSKGSNGVIVIKTKTGKGYSAPKGNFLRKVKGIFRKEKGNE